MFAHRADCSLLSCLNRDCFFFLTIIAPNDLFAFRFFNRLCKCQFNTRALSATVKINVAQCFFVAAVAAFRLCSVSCFDFLFRLHRFQCFNDLINIRGEATINAARIVIIKMKAVLRWLFFSSLCIRFFGVFFFVDDFFP